MQFDLPGPLAELTAVFRRYEAALVSNRSEVLDELFLNAQQTVRYGIAENLYGHDEIRAYRRQRALIGGAGMRRVVREQISTFGSDLGTTHIEFVRESGLQGRQSQTWLRTDSGWRICAAHVSILQDSD